MLRLVPFLESESCFALKGGTAINFFLREIPRLSVDIDLTYLPIESREKSLMSISQALERIAKAIGQEVEGVEVQRSFRKNENRVVKLFVNRFGDQITIEPNEVIRGTVFPCQQRKLVKMAEHVFEQSTSVKMLSNADLYAGKSVLH